MTYRAHVKNGQITLDEPANLPEGAELNVIVLENGVQITKARFNGKLPKIEPIEMPGGPLSDDIINDRR